MEKDIKQMAFYLFLLDFEANNRHMEHEILSAKCKCESFWTFEIYMHWISEELIFSLTMNMIYYNFLRLNGIYFVQ